MGLILDSSVVIAAERQRQTVDELLDAILFITGDQEAALSAVGLTELVHGLHRVKSADRRQVQQAFLDELFHRVAVYPYTREAALLAGALDAGQQSKGVTIPFPDLLIGATALSLGFGVLTSNLRHFRHIPGLRVIPASSISS